jgi:hypothetical protein
VTIPSAMSSTRVASAWVPSPKTWAATAAEHLADQVGHGVGDARLVLGISPGRRR